MAKAPPQPHTMTSSITSDFPLEGFRALFDASPDMLLIVDGRGHIVQANAQVVAILGYNETDLANLTIDQIIGKTPRGVPVSRKLKSLRLGQPHQHFKTEATRICGGNIAVDVFLKRIPIDDAGSDSANDVVTLLTVRDERQHQAFEQRILKLAHYDSVTGLINRTLLEDRAKQALYRAKRHHTPLAFLFIDLDYFKSINDHYGHRIGDLLLKAVGQRIQSALRQHDTLGRLGGDEFLVIAEDIQYIDDAMLIAEKVIKTLGEAFGIEGQRLYVTASVGISLFPQDGDTFHRLTHRADKAMYRAKELGRNKLCVADDAHRMRNDSEST